MASADTGSVKKTLESSATLLMGYALLCFITSAILNVGSGPSLTAKLAKEGGEVGPLTVEKAGDVYYVDLKQTLKIYNVWSFIDAEVLDEEKEFLFGFGEEVWSETGSDDEGAWSEKQESFTHKITFPEAGKFYLNFKAEPYDQTSAENVEVAVTKLVGSALAHFWIGLFSAIVSIAVWIWAANISGTYRGAPSARRRGSAADDEKDDDDD